MPVAGALEPNSGQALTAVLPTLDEEGSVGLVVQGLIERGVGEVIVADNGSTDRSAEVALESGAMVVAVPERGYGAACLGGLAALSDACTAVVFCDADGADDLTRLASVCGPVLEGDVDLVIGSRVLGRAEKGALSAPQRFGNWLSALLLRRLFGARVTDLGPFRCISRRALERIGMEDRGFGWTVEMQAKAYGLGLRTLEVPVDAKCRIAGRSKISGNLRAGMIAGKVILGTIWKHRRFGRDERRAAAASGQ